MQKIFLFLALLSGVASLSAMESVCSDEEKRLKEQFPIGAVLEQVDRIGEEGKAQLMKNPNVSEKRKKQLQERGGFVWREIVMRHYFRDGIARLYTKSENGSCGCIDPYDRWVVVK